jgi:hypothetical protein
MMLPGRDVVEVEALVTDRYLDSRLDAPERAFMSTRRSAASERPRGRAAGEAMRDAWLAAGVAGSRLDRGVRLASERLTRDLPHFHPSFRFEERLAIRLAEAAAAMRLPAAAGAEGDVRVVPFPAPELPPDFDPFAPPFDDETDVAFPRPLLIRGAITASAISLAGAAWVAWRRARAGGTPMGRAARAAHALRSRPVHG